jgi:VCBS repeat-containing protein
MNTIKNIDFNIGNGLKFDGVDDYVDYGNILNFEYTDAYSFNVILMIKSFSSAGEGIFQRYMPKASNGTMMRVSATGKFLFLIREDDTKTMTLTSLTSVSLGQLTSVTITKATGTVNVLKMYINGINENAIQSNVGTIISVTTGNSFKIGVYNISEFFDGKLFDFKVFNKELTQSEVTKLYQTQGQLIPASAIANLQADWRFNDKSGLTLKDYSENAYDGTLTNFETTSNLGGGAWVDKYGNTITQY